MRSSTGSVVTSTSGYMKSWTPFEDRVDALKELLDSIQPTDQLSESTGTYKGCEYSDDEFMEWDEPDPSDSEFVDPDQREDRYLLFAIAKLDEVERTAKNIRLDMVARRSALRDFHFPSSSSDDTDSEDGDRSSEGSDIVPAAALDGFLRLPSELILHTIELALLGDSSVATTLSHVNRELRYLTLSLPSLWANIDTYKSQQELEAYLERSQTTPLNVRLTMLPDNSRDEGADKLQRTLPLLRPHARRIRQLHAVYVHTAWLEVVYRFLESTPLPILHGLEIGLWNLVPSDIEMAREAALSSNVSWGLISACVWNLSAFRLRNHPALSSPRLKSLQISSYGALPFDLVIDALRGMPLLESLIIIDTKFISKNENGIHSLERVPSFHLRNAEFIRIAPTYVGRFGVTLDFTALESLNVTFAPPWIPKSESPSDRYSHVVKPDVYPAEFALQSVLSGVRALRRLDLGECYLPIFTLRRLFLPLDSLSALRLVYHGYGDVVSWLGSVNLDEDKWAGGLERRVPCPSLQTLLIEDYNVTGEMLLQVFLDRRGAANQMHSLTLRELDSTKFTPEHFIRLRDLIHHVNFAAFQADYPAEGHSD